MNYKGKLNLEELKKRYWNLIVLSGDRNWEIWLAVAAALIVGVIIILTILR
jgi:hypothetical protein